MNDFESYAPLFGAETPVTRLSGPFADLTSRVAFDGLSPGPPALTTLAGGTFGPFDLAGFEGRFTVQGTELKCLLREKVVKWTPFFRPPA